MTHETVTLEHAKQSKAARQVQESPSTCKEIALPQNYICSPVCWVLILRQDLNICPQVSPEFTI